jgi:lysophospholipase L1-like esterase
MKTILGSVPAFDSGDVITFIGDSITHGGGYHSDIFLFYATRFPEKAFRYYNCGISGDTALDVLRRFDRDIVVYKPNIATVLLGMNDIGREHYGLDKTAPEHLAAREAAFDVYKESMNRLASRLSVTGYRMIFITPTVYDQTAQLKSENAFGAEDTLRRCAEFVIELAGKYGSPVVDFHSVMSRVNHKLQKADPAATVVGEDRTHPGEAGHLLMACEFLRAQQMPEYVSSVSLDAQTGAFTETVNCRIEASTVLPAAISFACQEFSLPFPVLEVQKPALDWVPFQQKLNRQMLTVKNLKSGLYTVRIDEQPVGSWTAAELSQGVNLSGNAATPQYQQALEVKVLNDRRREIAAQVRAIAEIRCRYLAAWDPVPEDEDPLRKALDEVIEKEKGRPWYDHMKGQAEKYMAVRHSGDDLHRQIDELFAEIGRVNKPRIHRWNIALSAG